jgi:hypothetical protein
MSVREAINRRPWISVAVMGVAILTAAVVVGRSVRDTVPVESGADRVYFSDDDGKTYFADDASKIPPFDHNGKTAYLAGVFQFEGAKPFVACLIRYTPEGKAELERFSAAERNSSDPRVNAVKLRSREIKAPGEKKWTPADSEAFDVYLAPPRPEGATGIATEVLP